jgi:TolB-like protein/DNA-binding SARP family transcriptional activator
LLEFRVLGDFEVASEGAPITLPPSRKTRALLAYLALTRRKHRREELCEIFWEVPDDPRGALRWSLSKIRPLVDDPSGTRLVADRQTVELRTEQLHIDLLAAQRWVTDENPGIEDLVRAASLFRGPLLADLDLTANSAFHSWVVSLREDARQLHAQILQTLAKRLGGTPHKALPIVRELVRVAPYDETAWALLIANLAATGRDGELQQQYEAGQHALDEIGGGSGELLRAWQAARASTATSVGVSVQKITPAGPSVLATPVPRLSVVVLPFTNLSNDPEQQHFVDGITGDLMTDLSRIPDMLVISRNTAFTYRHRSADTKQIGHELGVRYVLEGEVQRSGNRVRVTAQLIDAESDTHLWAERFDGDAGDSFTLQEEIANRIAVALDLELVDAAAARPVERPDALDYILRGRAARLRPPSRANRAEQVSLFERALAHDQNSVGAQSWLAIELAARALDSMTDTAAADVARAQELAERAVIASPRSSVARFAKGQVLRAQHHYGDASVEYEAVISLNRNWAHAYSHLGWCGFMCGLIEELIPAQEQAIRLSPRDPQIGLFYSRIGRAHLLQSRVDEAVTWCEKARDVTPAAAIFRSFLASGYALQGNIKRAVDELAAARTLAGDNRYSSIARLRTVDSWGVPQIQALVENTYFAGLRKAGVSET